MNLLEVLFWLLGLCRWLLDAFLPLLYVMVPVSYSCLGSLHYRYPVPVRYPGTQKHEVDLGACGKVVRACSRGFWKFCRSLSVARHHSNWGVSKRGIWNFLVLSVRVEHVECINHQFSKIERRRKSSRCNHHPHWSSNCNIRCSRLQDISNSTAKWSGNMHSLYSYCLPLWKTSPPSLQLPPVAAWQEVWHLLLLNHCSCQRNQKLVLKNRQLKSPLQKSQPQKIPK